MKKHLLKTSLLAVVLLTTTTIEKASAQTTWLLTGNAGLNNATNFLGTTDSKYLKFRTANVTRMTISNTGKIGIGTQTPGSRLDILGSTGGTEPVVNIVAKYSGSSDVIGLAASSTGTDTTGIGVSGTGNLFGIDGNSNLIGVHGNGFYGVYGEANLAGTAGEPTGVYGYTSGGLVGNGIFGVSEFASGHNIGVWGIAADSANNGTVANTDFAGFFQGNIGYWKAYNISDAKFKKNIQPLGTVLDRINKLNTATYVFDRENHPKLYLPNGKQIGFIADNMESIFPELVINTSLPAKFDPKTHRQLTEAADFKMVDYVSMIPVLTAGIQEQQKQLEQKDVQIASLNTKLNALETRLAALENATGSTNKLSNPSTTAKLEQNNPNPFTQSTVIRYALTEENKSAQIVVTALNGTILKNYSIKGKGEGQITINANELAAGVYTYSLFMDGRIVDTKSLVLTK